MGCQERASCAPGREELLVCALVIGSAKGHIVGLTCRVGRAIHVNTGLVADLIAGEQQAIIARCVFECI
jgi:hypothetical protein